MKIIYKYGLVPLAAVLGVCWHLATAAVQEHAPAPAPQVIDDLPADYAADLTAEQRTLVERGRYVARLGDCVACHTGSKTAPMAGGLALETPFGKLYSTNITPDKATGMGGYSFAQFDRAMRKGVAADGRNLYPAMPYPSYAKMTEDDMQALYAYLMQGVTPVQAANQPSEMGFPFNQRWGLSLWNWLFLDDTPFQPQAGQSAEWNRGAYLVQGLGHCGACHTPRGIAFQEKTMTSEGPNGPLFLAGETVEGWRALSLRDLWTPQETAELLKTGRNRHGSVSGNMVDVVQHSTQYMSDGDLLAIGTYLKALPAGKNDLPMQVAQGPAPVIAIPARSVGSTEALATTAAAHYNVPADLYRTRGGLGYLQFCADCHRSDGAGVDGIFPPLAGNRSLQSDNASTLIHIMLTGWTTPVTQAHSRPLTMPAFAQLGNQEIADILNFTRRNWGRKDAPEVQARDVQSLRKTLDAKGENSRPFETPRLARMLDEKNADQLVYGARLNIETRDLLPKNVGNALNCASCHLNAGTVADGSPYIGISAFFPSYAPRAGRVITLEDRINGCFLRSMNGKPLPLDSDEMKAMVALFDWMRNETKPEDKVEGRGVGKISQQIIPNAENGKQIYTQQCALCHGADGEGIKNAKGQWVYPPLWGDESFNIGAGLARTYTAAAFVKRNMPIAFHGNFPLGQGGLSDQDAVDVAEYFSHQPRPDFAPKLKDWPNGKKPADARY
ncbi:c-type cytochrome [Comamonas terrigena]|jgi:thiosulfate dehydrogenase|uniref:c-type cytochrome n=1 Tax=Comamonas terrigena TaxID=32013 RepID=UPI00244C04C4|nr:c-type cytochrome [Comamonas terrigena]MDH0049919.1 c-type cytochrome [Comamonas terrigena]MDH0511132.1 c-type cytochrome [Comamonas terrigena]MDH1090734.1 c-type cytochrome [Comamonas terrigena]